MSIDNDKRIFATIRLPCVTLSQIALAPPDQININSPDLLNALKNVYSSLDCSVNTHDVLSSNLTDYIFVPLSYLLKLPSLNDTSITYILKIMVILMRNSWSHSLPYALSRQLFPLITFLTGGSPNHKDDSEIRAKSDELKLSGAEALYEFFKALANQKKQQEYDFFSNVENLPALGHVVNVLLTFAETGNSCVELQSQSLKTLSLLYFDLIKDGEIISYILPGNVSTLTKILASRGGQRIHYTILVQTIDLLKDLLVLVYSDDELGITYQDLKTLEDALLKQDGEFDHIQLKDVNFKKIHRTRSWLRGTSSQVQKALGNLIVLQDHTKLEVKQSLLRFCNGILSDCLYSLGTSIPIIVKFMANLSNSIPVNSNFVQSCKNINYLQSILSLELGKFIDNFASTIQSPNLEKISMNINSIQFLCELVNNNNEQIVSKLVETTIVEINDMLTKKFRKKSTNLIVESDTITDLMMVMKDMNQLSLNPKKLSIYDNVLDKEIQLKLARMFQSLGEQIDPTNIINEILIDDVDKNVNEKGLSLWIANNLMQGYITKIQPDLFVNQFIDSIIQPPEFTFVILDYCKSLMEMDLSEQVSCIAIDTIGVIANLMRKEFESELIDYLYPVIDALASSSEVIRNHALNTALIISDNLYNGSLNKLVIENTDYLIDAISIRLSNTITTRSTAILAVCTKLVGYEVVESFKDVIEITFSLLDYYHGFEDLCLDFFVLFEIIMDEVTKKFLNETLKLQSLNSESTFKPWGLQTVDQLINLLDKRDFNIVMNDLEEEIKEIDSDDEEEEQEEQFNDEIIKWVSPIPQDTYKLLQQMGSYAERLLTHPSIKLELQILRTLKKSIPLFATQHNNLLPIVANLWPIITNLVMNENPKIVISATEVLILIVQHSGSFVASRMNEFWQKSLKSHHLFQIKHSSFPNKQIKLPGLNMKCFSKLVELLTISLKVLGKSIPDVIIYEMIDLCAPLINDDQVESFGDFADIVWIIKYEKFDKTGLQKDDILIDGINYQFVKI